MTDLTTPAGLSVYLASTDFAALDIQVIAGGYLGFTYRIALQNPAEHGKTVVVKHYSGYASSDKSLIFSAERMTFECEALQAIAKSGLHTSESIVQVPRVLFYDPETHILIMNDLAPAQLLSSVLLEAFKSDTIQSVSSTIGTALGDFMGRFHKWSAEQAQVELRKRFQGNLASKQFTLLQKYDRMIEMAEKYATKKEWMKKLVEDGMREAQNGGDVIVMVDFWINNILVATGPELRIYIIDWEMVRCGRPEIDVGQFVASAYGIGCAHPSESSKFLLVKSFIQSYSKYLVVDKVQVALTSGRDVMSWGADDPWIQDESDQVRGKIVRDGLELLGAAKDHNMNEIEAHVIMRSLCS